MSFVTSILDNLKVLLLVGTIYFGGNMILVFLVEWGEKKNKLFTIRHIGGERKNNE